MHTRYRSLHLSIVGTPSRTVAYNIAKVQSNKIYIRCIASSLKFLWYGSMEWNMKKILVWNGRFLVWNGRKLPVWNMEKSSSIPLHTMPCQEHNFGPPSRLSTSIVNERYCWLSKVVALTAYSYQDQLKTFFCLLAPRNPNLWPTYWPFFLISILRGLDWPSHNLTESN